MGYGKINYYRNLTKVYALLRDAGNGAMMKPKRRCLKALLVMGLVALMLGSGVTVYLATRLSEGVQFAMKLTPGWNLANTLDAWGLGKDAGTPDVYETYWGSAAITQAEVETIAKAGFHTLRVPVTWFEHLDEHHHIDPVWLDRVQQVVDWALESGMYVIINAHHDRWYEPDLANIETGLDTMRAVWGQIATRFAAYDQRLIFEGMNEPRLIGQPEEWTAGTPEARACVNRLIAVFVETVRAAGGKNVTRYLLVPAYCASVKADALGDLVLPEDDHLMVSAHLYAPYDFALNEQGTVDWSAAIDSDTAEIREAFNQLENRFVSKGVPVVITEFGAADKKNEQARAAWAAYVTGLGKAMHIPCLWWDKSLMEQHTLSWRYPTLLSALIH